MRRLIHVLRLKLPVGYCILHMYTGLFRDMKTLALMALSCAFLVL